MKSQKLQVYLLLSFLRNIVAIPANLNQATIEKQLDANFDKAKRMSDFVQIIINLGFSWLSALFFVELAHNSRHFMSLCCGFCGIWAMAVSGYMYWYLILVVANHFMRDATAYKDSLFCLVFMVLAVIFAYGINSGVQELVLSIARIAGGSH